MTLHSFDRGLGRTCHSLGACLLLCLALSMGYGAGRAADDDWPYDVTDRQLGSDQIEPGNDITMKRKIEYHEEECWRQYDRRIVSRSQHGEQPGRVERFPSVEEQKLPLDLSGKWQTWAATVPQDFPCGPAYLAETVTAACTWWQRNVRPLRKPDIISPFNVTCSPM